MSFEQEFQELIARYRTTEPLKKEAFLELYRHFINLLDKTLLTNGSKPEEVKKQYHLLVRIFHPDKINPVRDKDTVVWLENTLSPCKNTGGSCDARICTPEEACRETGVCFKILESGYEKLINPQKFKEFNFDDIQSISDLKGWLEQLKQHATSEVQRNLYQSLLHLLNRSTDYFDHTGKIAPKGLNAILAAFPLVFSGYGAFILVEELLAIYSLYFVLLKAGQKLEHTDYVELRQLGLSLQQIAKITATVTTTLLVRLLEMTFWASNQFLDKTLQVGAAILPMITAKQPEHSSSKALVVFNSNHNFYREPPFINLEIKLIASPIESYLRINAQQYFKPLRAGGEKRKCLKDLLLDIRIIDHNSAPLSQKLEQIERKIMKIISSESIYNSQTKEAIDQALEIVHFHRNETINQLV